MWYWKKNYENGKKEICTNNSGKWKADIDESLNKGESEGGWGMKFVISIFFFNLRY